MEDPIGGLPRFDKLHVSFRLLFLITCICLIIAYTFNLAQIWEVHGGGGGMFGISPESIKAAYYGDRDSSTLESKLRGSMSAFATETEKETIIRWIRDGSNEIKYNAEIKGILERNCLTCHGPDSFRVLASFEAVKKVTKIDTGMGLKTLVRVSHIHLNGMTFLFFISGFITCFAKIGTKELRWTKWIIIVAPMVAMLCDILSWNLARTYESGVYVVIASGAVMTSAFFTQMAISVFQIMKSFKRT